MEVLHENTLLPARFCPEYSTDDLPEAVSGVTRNRHFEISFPAVLRPLAAIAERTREFQEKSRRGLRGVCSKTSSGAASELSGLSEDLYLFAFLDVEGCFDFKAGLEAG